MLPEVVAQLDLDARQGGADRPGLQLLAAQRRRHDGGGLREPVPLVDGDAGGVGELLHHLRRQRGRAGQHEPDRAEPLAQLLLGEPVGEDRRGDRDDAHGLVVDQVERRLRVEAVDQHQLGPVSEDAAQHGVQPVHVEEREHTQHDVVAVDHRRVHSSRLLDVGDQGTVGEHRGARTTRRTTGVEEAGELLRVGQRWDRARGRRPQGGIGLLALGGVRVDDVDPGLGRARDEVGTQLVGLTGERGPHLGNRLAHRTDGLGVGNDHTRPGVGDHPRELTRRRARVHRHRHDLGAQHPEVRRDELDAGAQRQHGALTRDEPGRPEPGGDAGDLLLELGPGHAAPAGLDDRQHVRSVERGLGDECGHVVRGHAGHDRTTRGWPIPLRG
jgi:hypothetical protein